MSGRWKVISPSQFLSEQDALDFIQRALPNREPFRAYSNFEFVADDGSINQVDLLIISRYSIFLVEINSRPGEVSGDSHAWIWRDGAREYFDDNPLLLTNRKAKSSHRCFESNSPLRNVAGPTSSPWSSCPTLRNGASSKVLFGKMFICDYQLEQVLAETDFHQDWLAKHVSLTNLRRRVRLYTAKRTLTAAQRSMLADAARREFQLLEGILHPGILRASDVIDSEHGPALIFTHQRINSP